MVNNRVFVVCYEKVYLCNVFNGNAMFRVIM